MGSKTMLRALAIGGLTMGLATGVGGGGIASADPGCGYYCQTHDGWHHPEWAGWNEGFPSRDWIPPRGWYPPRDWVPPVGWYPPPGYAPPPDWVGPCAGPLFDLFHPIRCL